MSATFTGGSGYSRTGSLVGTGAYTIAMWVKITTLGAGFQSFVGIDDGGSNYDFMGMENSASKTFRPDSRGSQLATGVTFTAGTWYYCAVTYDGAGNGVAYIAALNGGSLASTSGSFQAAVGAGTTTRIGTDGFGANMAGEVAYVRMWSAALNSTELEAERRSMTVVRSTSLIAAYTFDTASTTDNSGNGNTLTAIGTPGSGSSPIIAMVGSGTPTLGDTTSAGTGAPSNPYIPTYTFIPGADLALSADEFVTYRPYGPNPGVMLDLDEFIVLAPQTTTNPTGSGAVTLGGVTSAGSGAETITGSGSVTLGSVTSAGAGSSGATTGSGSVTLGGVTSAGTGAETFTGSSAVTLGGVTSAGTGTETITGTSAVTLGSVTSAGTGAETFSGSGSVTLGSVTSAGTGAFGSTPTGSGSVTLGGVTSAGTGTETITGSGSVTLAGVTSSGTGTALVNVTGTGAITLGSVTSSASGTETLAGSGSVTLGAATAAGSGTETLAGTGAVTLGAVTSAGTGTERFSATGAVTLGNVTSAGTGTAVLNPAGTGAVTLGSVTSTSTGFAGVIATLTGRLATYRADTPRTTRRIDTRRTTSRADTPRTTKKGGH